mmetsp:Transcript_12629/g.29573  ORF Transcript_12629/g.29573 Transcript_12629/m.29573 type:complete len:91 (+) Transcript_12629:1654-1926(+)
MKWVANMISARRDPRRLPPVFVVTDRKLEMFDESLELPSKTVKSSLALATMNVVRSNRTRVISGGGNETDFNFCFGNLDELSLKSKNPNC